MKKTLLITGSCLLVAAAGFGCDSGATQDVPAETPATPVEPAEAPTSQAAPAADTAAPGHYGAAFTLDVAKPLAAVVSDSEANIGKTVQVSGRVTSVCKKKGCWFVIQDAETPSVRVTMKDYGFFVPKDCDGKLAVVEGELQKKVVTEATRKHLAEDEGKDPSTVTGDKEQLGLVAIGVQLKE